METINSFPNLYTSRAKIPLDKWNDLQFLKRMMPFDTHSFYDNIPCEDKSRKLLKRQQQNEKCRQENFLEIEGAKEKKRNSDHPK